MHHLKGQCVCGSGKLFTMCCKPFINKEKVAKTPVQLMRSRYTAYALGGYGVYLLDTWLPSMTQGLDAVSLSFHSTTWLGLDIISKSQQGDQGCVEFKAHYRDDNGRAAVQHEKSIFKRINGKWFYVGGDVTS